jgi:hypothetical protein
MLNTFVYSILYFDQFFFGQNGKQWTLVSSMFLFVGYFMV